MFEKIPHSCIRYPWVAPLVLLLTTVLAYASSFPGAFVLDDVVLVQHNALVQHPDLFAILRADYWHGVVHSGLFRP